MNANANPAYFNLHIRPIFLYPLGLELPHQCGQPQHVFDPGHCPPSGQDHKGVRLAHISPIRWKIGQLPILGVIKYSPLPPALAAIHELKFPAAPGMKKVSYSKFLFCMWRIGCSSRPMPRDAWKT